MTGQPATQPHSWSTAVLRVATSLEYQYEVARGHFYADTPDSGITITPNTVEKTITVTNLDEGSYTIVRPGEDLGWQVDTWFTERTVHHTDTMVLALAVIAAHAETGTPPEYSDLITPDIFEEETDGKPQASHDRVAQLIIQVVYLHHEQRDKDKFAALAPGGYLRSHGGVVPFQAYGTWHGYEFYFRYRGGHASLRISETAEAVVSNPLWVAWEENGDAFDGYMEFHEFLESFARLAEKLEINPPSPEDASTPREPVPDIFKVVRA